MKELTFTVETCADTGGFVARWDDAPGHGGITTQGDSLAELHTMVADAVNGYFEPAERPVPERLHFVQGPLQQFVQQAMSFVPLQPSDPLRR